jgi:signal transduction histidine kinase
VKSAPAKDTVTVKAEAQENSVCIEVIDHGPGIPEHFQPRLFDRFSQAEDLNKSTGTGLGLSITKAIIDAHKGSISFTTSPEQGTTFRISIPVQQTMVRPSV